jgi:hypothetical protein
MPIFFTKNISTLTKINFVQVLLNNINMAYTSLNQISVEKDTWIVKVRIIRMWDAINIANDHELISLDMIMADENVRSYLFFSI